MFIKVANNRLSASGSPTSTVVDNIIANAKKFGNLPNALIKELNERESIIIQSRYGFKTDRKIISLADLAKTLNISLERVRQIEIKALSKLKNYLLSLTKSPDQINNLIF